MSEEKKVISKKMKIVLVIVTLCFLIGGGIYLFKVEQKRQYVNKQATLIMDYF